MKKSLAEKKKTHETLLPFESPLAGGPEEALPRVGYAAPSEPWNGLMLVGEAPGKEEARLGQPFVGRSGQLLNGVLEKAGIARRACFVANVFQSQPPGNKVDHFFLSRRKAEAGGIELAEDLGRFGALCCRADAARDIAELAAVIAKEKPRAIVALGRTPLWALTGENGLLDKVGGVFACRLAAGPWRVFPTYHPSFILRGNWGLQEKWIQHLEAALRAAQK